MKHAALALMLLGLFVSIVRARDDDERRRHEALQHFRAGQQAMNAESWDVAEREFLRAVKLDPLLDAAFYGLGQVYMATKRYPAAVKSYVRCRDAFQQGAAINLTDRLAAERRLEDQIKIIRESKEALQSGRIRTANTAASIDRLEDHIRDLERRRHRSPGGLPPTPPVISLALGSAYFRAAAFEDAEREYLAALEVDPKLGEAHNNLAVVYMLSGRLEEAETEIKLAEKSGFRVNPGLKDDLGRRKRQP